MSASVSGSAGRTADVRLEGEIDLANAGTIGDEICSALHHCDDFVVVDMSAVSFIDSTAITMMVRSHQYADIRCRKVIWRGVHAQPASVLEITGVDQRLDLEEPSS
jgi:anti-anti-sigma factor